MKNHLILGDWNALCDSCGRKFKASSLQKRWDGLIVCREDWEQRHPQDLLRVQREQISVPWARPYPAEDTYITKFGLFDTANVSDNQDQDYVELGYFLEDYIQDNFYIVVKWYRTFNDQLNIIESLALKDSAAIADSTTITETIGVVRRFVRTFTDTTTMSETKVLALGKALSDVTTIAETFTNAVKYARSYADTVTPTETTARTVGKALADTTTITESLTKVLTYLRSLSDTTAATDAGSIFYANYVGPSYFGEDYVGSTTTF
jgi:hypothetical protein